MKLSRKKIGTAGGILLAAALAAVAYRCLFPVTDILVVNAFQSVATDIYLNNDSRYIRITNAPAEDAHHFEDYDAVIFYARGLELSEQQAAETERAAEKGTVFFTVNLSNRFSTVDRNLTEEQHATLRDYFNNPGRHNYRNGLRYLRRISTKTLFAPDECEAPVVVPSDMFYHLENGKYFDTPEMLTAYLKEKGLYREGGRTLALISGVSFPVEGNRAHVDTLIARLARSGFNVYPLSGLNGRAKMLRTLHPDAVVYLPVSRLGNDSLAHWLHAENIPVFAPYPLMQQSREEWLDPVKPVTGPSLTTRIVVPEIDGAIAPLVVATQNMQEGGYYLYVPEDERINTFVSHINKYMALRDMPNGKKRVAVCYFKTPGKDALLASGMEVIPSLYNFLQRLQREGYDLAGLPETKEAFEEVIYRDGVVLGSYAKGAQERYLAEARPVWIDAGQYDRWARETLAPAKYAEVIERYGEAPGELLTRTNAGGEKQLAVACVRFGNVALFPQPRPALGDDDFKLVHGVPVAPPHSYLAPYLYARREFRADALIHFGTHGNLEFTPGKNVALSQNDWADALVGDLPHFYFYTTGNVGEAIIAKRRTHAVMVTHLTPPYAESGMRQKYADLLADLHKALDETAADRTLELRVKREAVKLGLHRDLDLDSVLDTPYGRQEMERLDMFAEEIANEKMQGAYYVLGEPYSPRNLLTTALAVAADPLAYATAKRDRDAGKISTEQLQDFNFLAHRYLPEARRRLAAVLRHPPADPGRAAPDLREALQYREQLIASTENELSTMINALNGGAVFPAPGGDPVLNPNVLPTGRNMFGVNAEMTPGVRAWEEGKRLAESTLEQYKAAHGNYPRKVSYTFWAGEFIATEGATLAQAFWMLGVEPVRDRQGHVMDLRLVPAAELGRPRINVVVQVSGQLRDIAGSRLKLLTEAIRLATFADDGEAVNHVASGTALQEKNLIEKGLSPKKARELSVMRVFGPLNSGYATGMLSYTENPGRWESEKELVDGYLNNMGAMYGDEEHWGSVQKDLFAAALAETDALVQPRQSNTWGPLSLDHVYEFTGSMSLAVKTLTGKEPEAYAADYRNRNSKRVQRLRESVAVETRATILNPAFIRERMQGEATTAEMFGETFRNIFGWNVMRPSAIDRELYNDLFDLYVLDKQQLGVREYFDRVNPAAYQSITAVMLESARRGYWKATQEQISATAALHAQSTQQNGAACTEFVCDNEKLIRYVSAQLNNGEAYGKILQNVRRSSDGSGNAIALKRENAGSRPSPSFAPSAGRLWQAAAVALALILGVLYLRRRRH
ncbi:MAG: cobaltochelatase subunit CobN [Bacteroidales bacterium]|jgi:cobaltochelatase CobN|nr:cobaltochelatase subunit CobN [Bacteroidales bacterium]